MPDIQPDFGAPGISAFVTIASWALGISTTVAFLALIFAVVSIAFKGFGNQNLQHFAASKVLWVLAATVVLGSLSLLFQFAYGFDLGLTGSGTTGP